MSMPSRIGRDHEAALASPMYSTSRPAMLSLAKLLLLGVMRLPFLRAAPTTSSHPHIFEGKPDPKPTTDPRLWIYLAVAVALVLLGGIFAGLTIALMGQDDVNLQVIHVSGDGKEKEHAGNVLRLLKRGKHWVLVTLLLSNVITNETLPIVLDRSLGGGWPAVLSSTVLIVIFGEIIPQSICVRYGLPIGAWMSPLVLVLMYILSPIAWPTAKLLDRLLGEDHGTVYKKAGLKTLVTLHRTLGTSASERLNQDEVTIISAVLDLKDKSVGSIMTPMEDVFTLSANTVLDEKMMDTVLSAGYSRIPIHSPDNPQNFIGMLLVKTLITYDPEDAKRVGDFALATLPETRPETSCLDIVNFFQEGKSHMVLVSELPGQDHGALGVVTLEDVIEELIGEEIIDESDVYIDVHKALKRKDAPPGIRIAKLHANANEDDGTKATVDSLIDIGPQRDSSIETDKTATKQRPPNTKSDTATSIQSDDGHKAQSRTIRSLRDGGMKRGSIGDLRGNQTKHFGPSNLASRPRQTRYHSVVIKDARDVTRRNSDGAHRRPSDVSTDGQATVNPSSMPLKDGARQMHSGYGTLSDSRSPDNSNNKNDNGVETSSRGVQANRSSPLPQDSAAVNVDVIEGSDTGTGGKQVEVTIHNHNHNNDNEQESQDTLNPLPSDSNESRPTPRRRQVRVAKSGSITENVVEAGGIRKVVLELTSESEEGPDTEENSPGDDVDGGGGGGGGTGGDGKKAVANGADRSNSNNGEAPDAEDEEEGEAEDDKEESTTTTSTSSSKKKKRRRKRRNGTAATASASAAGEAEDEPLLGRRNS